MSSKETPLQQPTDTFAERKQALRAEISRLSEQEKHPQEGWTDLKQTESRPEVIGRLEDELIALEKEEASAKLSAERSGRISEIRAQIKDLEQRAGHPIPGALKEEGLEAQILKLEDELRALEQGQKVIPQASTPVQEMPQQAVAETTPTPPETTREMQPEAPEPTPEAKTEEGGPRWEKEYLDYHDSAKAEAPSPEKPSPAPAPETPAPAATVETPKEKMPELSGVDPMAYYGFEKTPEPEQRPDLTGVDPLEYYGYRGAELDEQAKKLGDEEASWIRGIGEQYNKIPFKYKLAAGLTMGAAAAFGAAFAAPVVLYTAVWGLAAQRVAGGLGMFVKFEDRLIATQSETHGMSKSERQAWAAAQSLVYGALMGRIVQLGVEAAGDILHTDAVHGWILDHWPHGHESSGGVPVPPPETVAPPVAPHVEMPHIDVQASQGHGYEFMMKRVWEQLQDKHLDPSQFPENSDIHRLLMTDAGHIDQVVHQLAADPQHHFYNPDGTSVLMRPDAHMTLGADGQLHISDAMHPDVVHAPEGAPTTPPYHPEQPAPAAAPEQAPIDAGQHTEILTDDAAPLAGVEAITNSHGFPVIESQSHIYTGVAGNANTLYAYGGSAAEKAALIRDFFANPTNANNTILSSDANGQYEIPFSLAENGEIVAGQPLRSGGLFGFFGSFAAAPEPNDLGSIIQ